MSDIKVEVQPGAVIVNRVHLWHDTENIKILHIDCHSKYPVWMIGHNFSPDIDHEEFEVMLFADERTLRVNEELKDAATYVRVKFPREHDAMWTTSTDGGKYSVNVVFYRLPETQETLWAKKDDREDV